MILISVLSLFVVSCSSGQKKKKEQSLLYLQIGSEHLKNGQYPLALKALLEAEKLDQTNPILYNNLGLAYFVRDRFELAEKNLKKAVELDSKYTEARNNLGRMYIHLKKYDLAIKELKIAAEDLTYNFPSKVLSNLGLAYFRSGQFKEARDYFKKSLRLERENCFTFNYYGRSLFELKEYEQSAPSFDQAENLCKSSKFEEPTYFGALSYLKIGKRELAVTKLEEVVSKFPESQYAKRATRLLKILKKASL